MEARTSLVTGLGAVLLGVALTTLTFAQAPLVIAAPASVVATTPDEAVGQVVAASNAVYAGDCNAARSPVDIGKVCSKFIATRAGTRAYLIGRTFSEFDEWVFLEQTAAGWTPLGTAPLDGEATSLVIPWPAR